MNSPVIIGDRSVRHSWFVALNERFRAFAHRAAVVTGSPWGFTLGVFAVAIWALSGHWFGYSEGWQLVINTTTTIITFLMVFVVQNTQARDSRELHLKLDELLRAIESARSDMIRVSELSDEQLDVLHERMRAAATQSAVEPQEKDKDLVITVPEPARSE